MYIYWWIGGLNIVGQLDEQFIRPLHLKNNLTSNMVLPTEIVCLKGASTKK